MRRPLLAVLLVAVVVLAALVIRRLTAWAPPSQAAGRAYAAIVDRYLAARQAQGIFGSGGRWFCATRFLGAGAAGTDVSVYVWALCDETKDAGGRITTGTGNSLPVVVHLRRAGPRLRPVGFDEPGDAPDYVRDVRRLFPGGMAGWILASGDGGDVSALESDVIRQAERSSRRA